MPKRPTAQANPMPASFTAPSTTAPTEAFLYFLFPLGTQIDAESVSKVKEEIKNATVKKLYLVVDSPGGQTYQAVKIIRILRTRFNNIIGIVPFRAMSAATLMLLGTDKIYMGEESQLGPLDLPMEHPIDGSRISSLDVVNTLSQLSATGMSNAISMFKDMREERIGKLQAMDLAVKYSTEVIKAIAKNVDPYHRQKAVRSLQIAQWYAYDLLRTGMMKNRSGQSWSTAKVFVYGFPEHSYAIFKEEVRERLKLTIEDSDAYANWNTICEDVTSKKESATNQIITYIEK